MSEQAKHARAVIGFVVGKSSAKTAKVAIERFVQHRVYKKYVRRTSNLLVHDENDVCQVGDKISITQCRPVSKRKAWTLVEVIK